jgi:hypothetical protein
MAGLGTEGVTLAVLIGVLSAVVYAMRILVLIDKKLDRLLEHQGVRKK